MNVLIATEKPFSAVALNGIINLLSKEGFETTVLEKYSSKNDLIEAVKTANALIVRSDKIDREVLEEANNLQIIVRAGAGYDNIDLATCTEKGIVVMNTPGQNANAVAELAISLLIYMSRNQFHSGTGTEIEGKTLGIQAYGNVGRLVAKKALALGMNVMAYDPFISNEKIIADGVQPAKSLNQLYYSSDFISLHIPAVEETIKSIDYELLSHLPIGACLINTARAEVINEKGLFKVLEEREDLKYATDIAAKSQAQLDESFGNRVFATPKKLGAETLEANSNAGLAAARQIADYIKIGKNPYQVNR